VKEGSFDLLSWFLGFPPGIVIGLVVAIIVVVKFGWWGKK